MANVSDMEARMELMMKQVSDPSSAYYKGVVALLRSCEASDRRAKMMAKSITIPFSIPQREVVELEEQFGVSIRLRGVSNRAALTPRVSAMVHCLDSMLVEMASGGGRSALYVDGDLFSMVAFGLENKLVERSNASSRLAYGYSSEEAALRSIALGKDGALVAAAAVMVGELQAGGGEHLWHKVRADGPEVDVVVLNHFKTPCGPGQAAYLAKCRGATVLGCFPFQLEMAYALTGDLACFPGKFYVDKEQDVITLVPSSDATMSLSHPYSSLMELVHKNSVTVDGVEYLCEKFLTIRGILFYTLKPIGEDFEGVECLRTSLYDSAAARTTVVSFPRAKLSREGLLVGWERGTVTLLTSRFEMVMARCRTSANKIVTPVEVMSAFVDYNNVVINSLDTAVRAERMPYGDEVDASLALALHINYVRHQAQGSLGVLLSAVKARHSLNDKSVLGFALVAMSAWWSKPRVSPVVESDRLPVQQVVDWCGKDFGVTVDDAACWYDVETVAGLRVADYGRMYTHLPRPRVEHGSAWYAKVVKAAYGAVRFGKPKGMCLPVGRSAPVVSLDGDTNFVTQVVVGEMSKPVLSPDKELTTLKKRLVAKLAHEQGAENHPKVLQELLVREPMVHDSKPDIPVADVEPISAVGADMDVLLGGLPERDAVQTGYRLAEVDIETNIYGNLSVNDNRRDIPKGRMVRRPKVDAGVEGARPQSFAALLGAVKKRNVGIPANRGNVDLDKFPDLTVQRFIDVCFREDWEQVLARHLNNGLWEFNQPDIEEYMESLDETKARGLLNQFFSEGEVDLTKWLLMAKGKVKPSKEEDAHMKVDHSQTILYLENGTVNAAYSAMTKRFKKVLDEMLRPNVQINSQMNVPDHEEWYNSLESDRRSRVSTTSYSIDARSYDRSQDHVGLRSEMRFYARMGLSEERLRIWSQTHGSKKAVSLMFRLILWMVLGGVSGLWKTLLRNGLIMGFSTIMSTGVTRKNLVCLDVKGDDVDMEVDGVLDVDAAVDMMCMAFNLSAKFFTSDVRYFCKMFRIRKWGRWYFVADPWARIQTICTPVVVGNDTDSLAERWESIKPDLLHYDNGILVDEAALAAQQYYGLKIAPYGIARSLAKFAVDKKAYFAFFHAPEFVD